MVRHIVALRFKEGFTPEEKRANAVKIKSSLEALKGVIPGIIEFAVHIDLLPTSDVDVVFNTIFESEEALAAYQIHPEHLRAAEFVRSVRQDRICIDYQE